MSITVLKAGEGSRTLNIDLGKVVLCQLSYAHHTFHAIRFTGIVRGYEMFCDNGVKKRNDFKMGSEKFRRKKGGIYVEGIINALIWSYFPTLVPS